jgi:ATP-dependent Lon protease
MEQLRNIKKDLKMESDRKSIEQFRERAKGVKFPEQVGIRSSLLASRLSSLSPFSLSHSNLTSPPASLTFVFLFRTRTC